MHEPRTEPELSEKILTIRGQKVILDRDLAALYDVETKAINRAVKRNKNRFPPDFCFQLTAEEDASLRCQIGTSRDHGGVRHLPYVFTEHGAMMAANVLRSRRAIEMSVFVVRAFVRMRQAMLSRHEMEKRLDQIEKILLVHDDSLKELYDRIRPLLPNPIPAVTCDHASLVTVFVLLSDQLVQFSGCVENSKVVVNPIKRLVRRRPYLQGVVEPS